LDLVPDERARRGIFLAFQYPTSIPGVSMGNFLRLSLKSVQGKEQPVLQFRKLVQEKMKLLKMEEGFLGRYVNDGFSGGEKKRAEILQMALLQPQIAIMDENDSGLEIVAEISAMKNEPVWMRDFRLKSLDYFLARPMPKWGGDLSEIDFSNIFYYLRPTEGQGKTWEDVPAYIKNTFDRLGIPEAERKF